MGGRERRIGALEFLIAVGVGLVLLAGVPLAAGVVGDSSSPVGCHSAPVGDHSSPVGQHSAPCEDPVDFDDLNISFQPRSAPRPSGYDVDFGASFSEASGFGWTQVGEGPSRRQCGDRNATSNQAHDTFCHAQGRYELASGRWRFVPDDALWELSVPNATYQVTVTVGESKHAFRSVVNTFDVEGTPAVDGFIASASQKQVTATVTVSVADGRLSVDPGRGTKGKIAAITVKLAEGSTSPGPPSTEPPTTEPPILPDGPDIEPVSTRRINFVSKNGKTPTGWTGQTGGEFDATTGSGWRAPDGGPTEPRQCGRRGASSDASLDSFCHAQTRYVQVGGRWQAAASPAIFEVRVDPGLYRVTVAMGDSKYAFKGVSNTVAVEGSLAIAGFVATKSKLHVTGTVTVEVTDGFLTLDPTAGTKGKINWVVIEHMPYVVTAELCRESSIVHEMRWFLPDLRPEGVPYASHSIFPGGFPGGHETSNPNNVITYFRNYQRIYESVGHSSIGIAARNFATSVCPEPGTVIVTAKIELRNGDFIHATLIS